jgi:hypothetical protein
MAHANESRPARGGSRDTISFADEETTKNPDAAQDLLGKNLAGSITCASLRCEALRAATEIELDRLQVKILTAKAFNRDGIDSDADEMLRDIWRLLRATITPVRTELRQLAGDGR